MLTTLFLVLLAISGCNGPQAAGPSPVRGADGENGLRTAGHDTVSNRQAAVRSPEPTTGFGPAKVSILPLTELTGSTGGGQDHKLNVYVALLDAFGSQIKTPGMLRFELYEYVPRSAQRRGQRIAIWPDIDLTRPTENNRCWQDFLRAYEFDLSMRGDPDIPYVLEVTCVCPDGKRLSGECLLRSGR